MTRLVTIIRAAIIRGLVVGCLFVGIFLLQHCRIMSESRARLYTGCIIVYCFYMMAVERVRNLFRNAETAAATVEATLFSTSPWMQIYGVGYLSTVAGRRFGSPMYPGRELRMSVKLWRRWWVAHKDNVVFDKVLNSLLTPDEIASIETGAKTV